ncbi:MAG: hypothetical protein PVJ76_13010 [Gemmatimonadota bacterium]
MTEPDLVGLFVAPLEALGLRYMITGGVAAVIYGDPRFTRDISAMLEISGDKIDLPEVERWIERLGLGGGVEVGPALRPVGLPFGRGRSPVAGGSKLIQPRFDPGRRTALSPEISSLETLLKLPLKISLACSTGPGVHPIPTPPIADPPPPF